MSQSRRLLSKLNIKRKGKTLFATVTVKMKAFIMANVFSLILSAKLISPFLLLGRPLK